MKYFSLGRVYHPLLEHAFPVGPPGPAKVVEEIVPRATTIFQAFRRSKYLEQPCFRR